jgi:membrane associated rhomboid family serine protease
MAVMYQTQTQNQFYSPTKIFTPVVTTILALLIISSILTMSKPDFMLSFFAISSQGLLSGKVWQLITYPFVNGISICFVFSCLVVLFVGSAVERQWRKKSFLLLWLVTSFVCGLIWLLISLAAGGNYVGAGVSSCVYGLIATFGILYRGQKVFIFLTVLKAQYAALILIAIGILLTIMQPMGLIWVSGSLVAYFYIRLRLKISEQTATTHKKSISEKSGRFVDID